MRVVICTRAIFPFHGYGGMERYFYYLAKALAKNGVDVEIVASPAAGKSGYAKYNGLCYTFIPPSINKKPLSSITHYLFDYNVMRYLKKAEFDVLHGNEAVFPYVLLKPRKPVVAQPFGLEQYKAWGLLNRIDRAVQFYPENLTYQLAEAVASEGELQTREILKLFRLPRKKIVTLPDGVDIPLIKTCIVNSRYRRSDIGLAEDDLVLMSVNRLDVLKGLGYLIEALDVIRKEISGAKLILVGTGPEEKRLMQQIRNAGLEKSVLHFKNVPYSLLYNYYRLADIYVSPGLQNCLLISVLEAMACGLPVVATDPQEGTVRDGFNGYVVPPRDPNSIADAIIKMYDNNETMRMGRRSENIAKGHDWGIIAKKAIKCYELLAGARK